MECLSLSNQNALSERLYNRICRVYFALSFNTAANYGVRDDLLCLMKALVSCVCLIFGAELLLTVRLSM